MSSSHYKFNRPDFRLVGRIGQGQPDLELSGTFPDAVSGSQYSGSINVLNAIGAFTVEMTAGSLPPGAVVFADTTAGKVFVEWPEYAAESGSPSIRDVTTPNHDFSQGDSGWLLGTGWVVKPDGTSSSGPNTAQYGNAGASIIWSASEFPVEAGDEVRFGARINPSENGNSSSGQSTVSFFKSNGEWISSKWNPDGSAGSSYQWDYVYAIAPAESTKYRVGVIGNKRRASTNPVRVDVVDHKLSYTSTTPEQGTDEEGVWNFTLKASDSAGRSVTGNFSINVTGVVPVPGYVNITNHATFGGRFVSFDTDGKLYIDGLRVDAEWWSKTEGNVSVPGIGNDYEVRFSAVGAGANPIVNGGTPNSWIPINAYISARMANSVSPFKAEIRDIATGTIRGTATYTYA